MPQSARLAAGQGKQARGQFRQTSLADVLQAKQKEFENSPGIKVAPNRSGSSKQRPKGGDGTEHRGTAAEVLPTFARADGISSYYGSASSTSPSGLS